MLTCVRLVDFRHRAAFGGYYRDSFLDDIKSDIDVCKVNNVDSDYGDPAIVHLRCLCDFSLLRFEKDYSSAACSFRRYAAILLIRITVRTSFGLFILGHFINMHYGHIASDKGASMCERSVLSFVIRVLILHTTRLFHSAI